MRALGSVRVESRGDLPALEVAVYQTLAYSDVFDFPLTVAEVWKFLAVQAMPAHVLRALEDAAQHGLVDSKDGYFFLSGRGETVESRRMRSMVSHQLMRRALSYGSMIGRLPFIRMVAVSGSLAAGNAREHDDIDYLIVTAPGRVWMARALTMLVVRLAAVRGLTLCPNYIISDDSLSLAERDLYMARELAQMVPVAGGPTYRRMLGANPWLESLLPNFEAQPSTPHSRGNSLPQLLLERLLGGRVGGRLERWIFERKSAELRREAGGGAEVVFDEAVCKGHMEPHRERTRAALADRMRALEGWTE
jgi:hypothetical protein